MLTSKKMGLTGVINKILHRNLNAFDWIYRWYKPYGAICLREEDDAKIALEEA